MQNMVLHFLKHLLTMDLNGDNIVAIDGKTIEQTADVIEGILIDSKRNVTVDRKWWEATIALPSIFAQKY